MFTQFTLFAAMSFQYWLKFILVLISLGVMFGYMALASRKLYRDCPICRAEDEKRKVKGKTQSAYKNVFKFQNANSQENPSA